MASVLADNTCAKCDKSTPAWDDHVQMCRKCAGCTAGARCGVCRGWKETRFLSPLQKKGRKKEKRSSKKVLTINPGPSIGDVAMRVDDPVVVDLGLGVVPDGVLDLEVVRDGVKSTQKESDDPDDLFGDQGDVDESELSMLTQGDPDDTRGIADTASPERVAVDPETAWCSSQKRKPGRQDAGVEADVCKSVPIDADGARPDPAGLDRSGKEPGPVRTERDGAPRPFPGHEVFADSPLDASSVPLHPGRYSQYSASLAGAGRAGLFTAPTQAYSYGPASGYVGSWGHPSQGFASQEVRALPMEGIDNWREVATQVRSQDAQLSKMASNFDVLAKSLAILVQRSDKDKDGSPSAQGDSASTPDGPNQEEVAPIETTPTRPVADRASNTSSKSSAGSKKRTSRTRSRSRSRSSARRTRRSPARKGAAVK